MPLSYNLNDRFPVKFSTSETDWTLTDTANTTAGFVLNNGSADVKTTSSCAGSAGLAPMKGARILSCLEGIVYAALDESAEAEGTYATALKANATLVTELATELKAIFDSMEFYSSVD